MKKRILSILMSLAMFVSVMPVSVHATESDSQNEEPAVTELQQESSVVSSSRSLAMAADTMHENHALCTNSDCGVDHPAQGHTVIDDWQPLNDTLPTAPGNYYLTQTINLFGDSYNAPDGVTICLNGYKIKNYNTADRAITKTSGGVFTICDCQDSGSITGGSNSNAVEGGGVYLSNGTFNMYGGGIKNSITQNNGGGLFICGGTFNMYGGTISGNKATVYMGAGVHINNGEFYMYNGSITNNTATNNAGGGMHIRNRGKVYLYGGEITNNTSESIGGGIYYAEGNTKLHLAGDIKIKDNKRGTKVNNINITQTYAKILIDGPLTCNAGDIGITLFSNNGVGEFANASRNVTLTDETVTKFSKDVNDGHEVYRIDNKLYVGTLVTVSFDANGGTGTKEDVTAQAGTYTLPTSASEFTAPDGKVFAGWAETADGDVIDDDTIDLTEDITLYAVWKTPTVLSELTYSTPENGEITVKVDGATVTSGSTVESGEIVTIEVNPSENYIVDKVKYNDTELTEDNGVYTFTMPEEEVTITATFKVVEYPVWVAGVQLTSLNEVIDSDDNITGHTGGTATYDPEEKTLTLDNFNFTGEGYNYGGNRKALIYSEIDLEIIIKGTNTLAGIDYLDSGIIITDGNLTITDLDENYETDFLKLASSEPVIYVREGILSIENVKLSIKQISPDGNPASAIYTNGDILIDKSDVTVISGDSDGDDIPQENGGTIGIYSYGEISVTDSTLFSTGYYFGIWAESLDVNNSTITAVSYECGSIGVVDNFDEGLLPSLEGDFVVIAGDDEDSATEKDTTKAETYANKYVKIIPVIKYPVWVAGVQLTSLNEVIDSDDNITGHTGGTAKLTVGEDEYGDPTFNLLLDNFKYEGVGYNEDMIGAAIFSWVPLNIQLKGNNAVTLSDPTYKESTYNLKGYYRAGIFSNEGIVISDAGNSDGTLIATGDIGGDQSAGILAFGDDIIINSGKITAVGRDSKYVSGGILQDYGSIIINGGEIDASCGIAEAYQLGIGAGSSVVISDGTVTATASSIASTAPESYSVGIMGVLSETISNGIVNATGGNYGLLFAEISGGQVTAMGGTAAFEYGCVIDSSYEATVYAGERKPGKVEENPTSETFTTNKYVKIGSGSASIPSVPSVVEPSVEGIGTDSEADVEVDVVKTNKDVRDALGRMNVLITIDVEETDELVEVTYKAGREYKNETVYVLQYVDGEFTLVDSVEADDKGKVVFTVEGDAEYILSTVLPEAQQPETTVTYGWKKTEEGWKFYDYATGEQRFGWVADGKNWYFINRETGIMHANTWIARDASGSVWYYVGANGAMVFDVTVDGYYIDVNGEWKA